MLKEFAKGHRSIVYISRRNIVKTEKPSSKAINRINNEAHWLSILNEHNIGPKLIKKDSGSITIKFVKGSRITEWLKTNSKKNIKNVLIKILNQCRTLDKLHVNKYELTNPYKHIIINKTNPVMIDFERCRYSVNPKNLTQFCQFITSLKISKVLESKGIILNKEKLKLLLRMYKHEQNDKIFDKIIRLLH